MESCGERPEAGIPRKTAGGACLEEVRFDSMESSMLRMGSLCGMDVAEVRSVVGSDTLTKRFLFLPPDEEIVGLTGAWADALPLRVPVSRVAPLSSSQIGYMARLQVTDRIVGIDDGKYVVDSVLRSRLASSENGPRESSIVEVGSGSALSMEKLLLLKPELVMSFATGGGNDDYERINSMGLPLMLTSEWQEDSPLAKAEWIKLYGKLFCGTDSLVACSVSADTIFGQSKRAYGFLSGFVRDSLVGDGKRPRVLAGMAYGGVWYAPGGKSYTAKLIHDAGGRYLWESDTSREMKLSLETVLALSDSADVWINPGMFHAPDEILAAEPRVKGIRAFREGLVFQNDGRMGPMGGNDFFEGAVARPAELLYNLASCLFPPSKYPSMLPERVLGAKKHQIFLDDSFKWYRNIYNY